jgi:hypothetical protein
MSVDSKMTLDDIQESIYQGDKAINKALSLADDYATKHSLSKVKEMVRIASLRKLSIPIAFTNQISTIQRYKTYVKDVLPLGYTPTVLALKVMEKAESESNKRILAAKESDTRKNRQFEKNEVMKLFKNNFAHLISLFELHKMLNNIKREINGTK